MSSEYANTLEHHDKHTVKAQRVAFFVVLIGIMISMSYIISNQLFKFGIMAFSAFVTPESEKAVAEAGQLMQSMTVVYNGLAVVDRKSVV